MTPTGLISQYRWIRDGAQITRFILSLTIGIEFRCTIKDSRRECFIVFENGYVCVSFMQWKEMNFMR